MSSVPAFAVEALVLAAFALIGYAAGRVTANAADVREFRMLDGRAPCGTAWQRWLVRSVSSMSPLVVCMVGGALVAALTGKGPLSALDIRRGARLPLALFEQTDASAFGTLAPLSFANRVWPCVFLGHAFDSLTLPLFLRTHASFARDDVQGDRARVARCARLRQATVIGLVIWLASVVTALFSSVPASVVDYRLAPARILALGPLLLTIWLGSRAIDRSRTWAVAATLCAFVPGGAVFVGVELIRSLDRRLYRASF